MKSNQYTLPSVMRANKRISLLVVLGSVLYYCFGEQVKYRYREDERGNIGEVICGELSRRKSNKLAEEESDRRCVFVKGEIY